MKNRSNTVPTAQDLLDDLHALVAEAEAMFANPPPEQPAAATDSLRARLAGVQDRFSDAYTGMREKVVAGAKRADETIRTKPYQSLAIAAGVGLIVGVLLGRRNQ